MNRKRPRPEEGAGGVHLVCHTPPIGEKGASPRKHGRSARLRNLTLTGTNGSTDTNGLSAALAESGVRSLRAGFRAPYRLSEVAHFRVHCVGLLCGQLDQAERLGDFAWHAVHCAVPEGHAGPTDSGEIHRIGNAISHRRPGEEIPAAGRMRDPKAVASIRPNGSRLARNHQLACSLKLATNAIVRQCRRQVRVRITHFASTGIRVPRGSPRFYTIDGEIVRRETVARHEPRLTFDRAHRDERRPQTPATSHSPSGRVGGTPSAR